MYSTHHRVHVPVMGTGFTIDTPVRTARFGISSVVSLVDDILIERMRKHYCKVYGFEFAAIPQSDPDARAKRITAYFDVLHDIVARQMLEVKALPFEAGNDKTKYFELLPDASPVRQRYLTFLAMPEGDAKRAEASALTDLMLPGSIDANIMTKLDRAEYERDGSVRPPEFSHAKAALRGYALSKVSGNMVMSAGINPTLYGYLESFPDFYRQDDAPPKKGLILKVSDYRSSMVQGRFLAKKGIEVKEFRIESGLNCGGHAFASDGYLMGPILQEFLDNRARFPEMFEPMIVAYYKKRGKDYPASAMGRDIPVTAQGGLGTHGEMRRLMEFYGLDATGWASPFLLVPEVTALDHATRQQLAEAKEEDLYLSDASPLGVPFNNLRQSTSEKWSNKQIDSGKPGSPCPKGYLESNTEFTDTPICTASKNFMKRKLDSMGIAEAPKSDTEDTSIQSIYVKQCICDQLANGALIQAGLISQGQPVAVCPGPNIAYFDRLYTLREMMDHIYGRGLSLVPADRPHLFAKDLQLTVDYFIKLATKYQSGDAKGLAYLVEFKTNIEAGIRYYRDFVTQPAFAGENLASLAVALEEQSSKLADTIHKHLPLESVENSAAASVKST
jgi:NAD(P)H-dependent flavin oxidoreductase YrpB (nitropropane dioxygenase family)